MTTDWTLPKEITQYVEDGAEHAHIAWNNQNNFINLKNKDGKFIQTVAPLKHIARSPKYDIKMKTWYIQATSFNFINLPNTITGIEARLSANRRGRITDETIQLCLSEQLIGTNRATLDLSPIKIYGNPTDLWETENLTTADLQNPLFGIVIRFQSHPHWPHSEPALIDAVELRIH